MESYSEIECAFITRQFSIEAFLTVCELLKENSFRLNKDSPGYVCGGDFEYPDWKTIEQVLEQIKKGSYSSFCINLQSQGDRVKYGSLTVEVELGSKCIAIKTSEEAFVDKEANKINRSVLVDFIGLMQKLTPCLDVVAWRIAQSGFDYDLDGNSSFVDYSRDGYPETNIDKLIAWYDQEYLSRWD